MDEKELEERVDEILLKRTRGEKLTKQEEKILAYGYYAADRRSVCLAVSDMPDAVGEDSGEEAPRRGLKGTPIVWGCVSTARLDSLLVGQAVSDGGEGGSLSGIVEGF